MRNNSAFHDLLVCGLLTGILQKSVPCATNIISYPWFCFPPPFLDLPTSREGDTWYRLVLPLLTLFWVSMMPYLSHLQASDPLQLKPVSENPWGPWRTTSLRWGWYCTSSGPWTLPVLLWTIFPPPTHSSWYPCSTWRVGMMRWSRGLIVASKCMSRFT